MHAVDREALFRAAFPHLSEVGLGVLDVGARGGLHHVFDELARYVHAIGFEPDAEEYQALERAGRSVPYRSASFLPLALGAETGSAVLHLCRSRGASSLRQPNVALLSRFPDAGRFTVERTTTVNLVSLDSLTRSADPKIHHPVDFLKLDAQGAELDILTGARETLRDVVGLEVEVEFAEMYLGQPLFRDVDRFVAEHGLKLFKLRRMEWVRNTVTEGWRSSAGQIIHGDALYLRDPLDGGAWRPTDARQAEALIAIACVYDLHDFAVELASTGPITSLVQAGAVKEFVRERCRALTNPRRQARTPLSVLRAFAGMVLRRPYLHDPQQHWARGDRNFYSQL